MFLKTAVFFAVALYLTFFKSAKSESEDAMRKKSILTNILADSALFKVRTHMQISGFEPIDVFQFSVMNPWDHRVLDYNFTMHRGKLTYVKTLNRYGDVKVTRTRDGYTTADIPLTFKPLKYKANYSLDDYSGRATATVKNVKAILTTKYRVVFELNFQKISVTDLGTIGLKLKPSSPVAEDARPEVEERLQKVIAQRVEESITDYFSDDQK